MDQDNYGTFQSCLQCGYIKDLVDETGAAIGTQPAAPATDASWMNLLSGLPEAS
ncbi:MAG: hypothetical protein ACE5Q6_14620 [Dehalococcoidia bacterium]